MGDGSAPHFACSKVESEENYAAPWQRLNFLPEPQGQGLLRDTSPDVTTPFSSAAVY